MNMKEEQGWNVYLEVSGQRFKPERVDETLHKTRLKLLLERCVYRFSRTPHMRAGKSTEVATA